MLTSDIIMLYTGFSLFQIIGYQVDIFYSTKIIYRPQGVKLARFLLSQATARTMTAAISVVM
jgi:hypothetical protein